MDVKEQRQLGLVSLATLLVSAHYGLGFILGTAEKSFLNGAAGSLYAIAIGLGTVALACLAQFYWVEVEQIWTLLGDRYGKPVKIGVGLMSWTSLIGVAAVQLIAAAAILNVAGIPTLPSLISLAILFCFISLLPVERASLVFRVLLLSNILALAYCLKQLDGGIYYLETVKNFIPEVGGMDVRGTLGVMISTVLLVAIDMKCQQFVVRAKSIKIARWGCIVAGICLMILAFLPGAVAIAAQNSGVLPGAINGKSLIPYILFWVGNKTHPWIGIVLILILAVPALGIGSNILRIQTKTIVDLELVENTLKNRAIVTFFNAILAFGIALRGGEIVGLILCFYAAYASVLWVPLAAYLLSDWTGLIVSPTSVRFGFAIGSLAALSGLGISLVQPEAMWFDSVELTILVLGLGFSSLGLLGTRAIEKLFPVRVGSS